MTSQPSNFLSKDIEITGTLTFDSTLVSEAKINGDILSSGTFVLGQDGVVTGDIQAGSIAISGKVTGNVTVDVRCELHKEASLIGDLKAPRLIIHDGATFIGYSEIVPPGSALPANITPISNGTTGKEA